MENYMQTKAKPEAQLGDRHSEGKDLGGSVVAGIINSCDSWQKPLQNSCPKTSNLAAYPIPTVTNNGFSFQHILLTHKTLSFATPMVSEFSNVIPH